MNFLAIFAPFNLKETQSKITKKLLDWPNSLDCTDLNQCGARRDAELFRLCYKQNKQSFQRNF